MRKREAVPAVCSLTCTPHRFALRPAPGQLPVQRTEKLHSDSPLLSLLHKQM